MYIKNVLEYFEETVRARPGKVAVIDGERNISFADLSLQAKSIAITLSERLEGKHGCPVALFLGKSIESVASDIGIIYSGNAYMNLDIKTPIARLGNILELVKPACIITDEKHLQTLSNIWPREKTLLLEQDLLAYDEGKMGKLYAVLENIIDTDPLCLINTSGSTGTPKSVILNHRSFVDFTEWAIDTTGIGDEEIIGSLSPIVFDIYSFELCMLMAKSSTIVVLPDSLAAFPAKMLQIMEDKKVTFIFWVPTIMVSIANMDLLSRIPLPALKMVWFAGEVFPTKQFNYWHHSLPDTRFVNLYGPIEITLDCTYFIVDREIPDEEPLPIGYPCRNTNILILNDENKPAATDEEGELCVRGSSLAMGYYNNPEKTAAAFVQNPLNNSYPELIYRTGDLVARNERGEIMFRGRKDSLVKHSGYRIELGEIEHVIINTLQLVKNGCIVYDYSRKEIVFFYEAEKELPVSQLRKQISTAFPKYMIPNRFVFMDELPRNTNGKIDRLKLKENANGQ